MATAIALPVSPPANRVPIGRHSTGVLELDLDRLLAGRLLLQGSSGAGKSKTLRKIVEEAFDYVTTIIVDPEGEFGNLAQQIGAITLRAAALTAEGLTAAGVRARAHRLALYVDLSDLDPDERIVKAAALFAGLLSAPREHWGNTVLVCIDEAHLLAPHLAGSSRDAEIRRLGVATLTDLCARGRKRGIAPIIATQRLAKLAASVTSELHNAIVGLNVFDRDIARAADLLGFTAGEAGDRLRRLRPGEFYALGPALSTTPIMAKIDPTITEHLGVTPELRGASDISSEEAERLLDLASLQDLSRRERDASLRIAGKRALDAFLLDPSAPLATRIVDALRRIAPSATTASDLSRHLGVERPEIDSAIDMLAAVAAVDAMPRGEDRIARLAARLRQKAGDVAVVGLA